MTSRLSTSFSGYKQTFPEFLASLKAGPAGATAGPVHVDLHRPAVDQLWDKVRGVIGVATS